MKTFEKRPPVLKRQRGIVLVVTLLVLVAMTLASVGMMRSVDSSVMAVGNMALKQASVAATTSALENFFRTGVPIMAANQPALQNNGGVMNTLIPGIAYFASIQNGENAQGIPAVLQPQTPVIPPPQTLPRDGDFQYRIVVERMCRAAAVGVPASPQDCESCQDGTLLGLGGGRTNVVQHAFPPGEGFNGCYRVSVRIDGPFNTRSFAQAFVEI
ncbi:MAG: hypothetical protein FWC38_04495 [Proteobacteria bacterium]|nr:hypothetical protein [Pseudomonadota bacterium]MCL2307482.1 hypothetical protein [Pseudomonadota bacterium]